MDLEKIKAVAKQVDMDECIKSSYTYKEIFALQKFSLEKKIAISVEVIRRALQCSQHRIAIAFSGGKDSQVVSDLIERFFPEEFQRIQRKK